MAAPLKKELLEKGFKIHDNGFDCNNRITFAPQKKEGNSQLIQNIQFETDYVFSQQERSPENAVKIVQLLAGNNNRQPTQGGEQKHCYFKNNAKGTYDINCKLTIKSTNEVYKNIVSSVNYDTPVGTLKAQKQES